MTVFSKQGKSSRATMLVAILGILSILTGCGENDAQRRNTSPDRQLIRDFSSDNPFKMEDNSEKAAVEAVQLVISSVTIARSDDSRRERIWQLLNPMTLSGSNQQNLLQNGLQIASNGPATWRKVTEIITSGIRPPSAEEAVPQPATVRREQEVVAWLVEGMVAELALNVEPEDQTLFRREPGKPLVGNTYENCYRLVRITGGTDEQGQVYLSITPALRSTVRNRATVLRQRYDLGYQDREPYVAKFDNLAINSTVRSGEFVAIGWQKEAGEAAFGGSFFHNDVDGQAGTTILLIFPRKVKHIPGKGFVVAED